MPLEINLENKVAIVTGVTSGIGRGVAKMLAKAGCQVAGCSISSEEDDSTLNYNILMEGLGKEPFYRQIDVTKTDQLQSFVQEVVDYFGRIDLVVSNAGVNVFTNPEECTDEMWDYNIDLNLKAHWYIGKLARPSLKINNGVFIIITSNHAYTTIPNCFPYNVAKTALTGLVRTLAIEWGPEIRTIGIAPGFIETEGGKKWFAEFSDPVKARKKIMDLHPVRRLGTVDEIGGLCAFLSSEYAAFISGVTYLVDGGRSAVMQDL